MNHNVTNRVIVVPHTHWDREWYLPFEAFRMRLVKLIDSLCENLEADPDERFHLDGQTIVLEDYEEIRGKSEKLSRLIAEGRIDVGPWYVQPDEALPTGEAIIRNLQIGINTAKKYGKPTLVGYLPDMFGHIGQLPQIFKGLGINRAIAWRGVPASMSKCAFIWRAPDGTEVFTAFLPMSYSNGMNLDLEQIALKTRIILTRAIMGRFIEGPTWLLMAGTDHQQPKKGLARALKEAFTDMADWEVKIGTLPEYFDALEKESSAKPTLTGELRDPHYAPILPSVGSTRVYLKKRDFAISSLLERYAEPLASWAWSLGGTDQRDFLLHTWKLLLENHPHDSICGCSTDEVHRAMMPIYDRVDTLARRILNQAAIELGGKMNLPDGKWFAAWAPAGKDAPTPIISEIDGMPPKGAELVGADGKHFALQMIEEIVPGLILGKGEAPAMLTSFTSSFLFQEEEMLGGHLIYADLKPDGEKILKLTVGIGTDSIGLDVQKTRKEIADKVAQSGAATLRIEIVREPRVKVAAVADSAKPYSLNAYRIAKHKGKIETDIAVENGAIENSFFRVSANDKGNLIIHDRANNVTFNNALKFFDEGDRGDEYNFEPTPEDAPIMEPVKSKSRIVFKGPAAARLRIESVYRLPVGLDKSRKRRSKTTAPVKIVTDVTIYSRVQWIDFRTVFDNCVRDHRLCVRFEAPFSVEEFLCEAAFEVTARKSCVTPVPRKPDPTDVLSMLIGPEAAAGYGPHRGFAALEKGGYGVSLFNRGLLEIEAVKGEKGTALSLTLVRGVGSLSRDDMTYRVGHAGPDIETPDAQCPGGQVCEFAFTSYKGTWQENNLPAVAHSWRHPPRLHPIASGAGGALKSGDSPIRIDNPAMEIRALQPAPDGGKALCARIYNTTDTPQTGKVEIDEGFISFKEADLMGEPIPDKHIKRDGERSAILELPPMRIATIRLEFD